MTLEKYKELEAYCEKINLINGAMGILGWDAAVMLQPGSSNVRGQQLATLGVITHEMFTSDKTGELLDAINLQELNDWQKSNVREINKAYINAKIMPSDLVSATAKATTTCEQIWREARKQSDFNMLLPSLKEVLHLNRLAAQLKSSSLGFASPYEAMMDLYDPGMTEANVDAIFGRLKQILPQLIQDVVEKQKSRPAIIPFHPVLQDRQQSLGSKLAAMVGFDTTKGRIDVSTHPFCGGCTGDVRITTRYNESAPLSAMMGILHESGHAVYEQNRPQDWLFQAVGEARGMSIHESQSLIIEMQASRTPEFIGHLTKMMIDEFCSKWVDPDTLEMKILHTNGVSSWGWDPPPAGTAYDPQNIYNMVTTVKPDFIRVEADEVTYPAHIIVRYDVEKALINGEMEIEDLPAAFNAGIKTMLGLDVPNDAQGCLQDIHWPSGGWGYFPSYTLGAMTAAQLFDSATKNDSSIIPSLSHGDFSTLRRWLNEKIHMKGSLLSTDELIKSATGRSLDPAVFERHLRNRYLD